MLIKTSSATPIVRWAGSKRQILPKLASLSPPQYRRYIEPFCGSASLFLELKPSTATLGDANPHLIGAYKTVRRYPHFVAKAMQRWEATQEQYLALRAARISADPILNAARFLFLNHYCFNGVYRENRDGRFNVPFGGIRVGPLPTADQLARFAEALRNTSLKCGDFAMLVKTAGRKDFIYLDPPYSYGKSRNRGEYGRNAFSDTDIGRLVAALEYASAQGAFVLLSFNRAPRLSRILKNWSLTYCEVNRSVAGFSQARRRVREYQLRNY